MRRWLSYLAAVLVMGSFAIAQTSSSDQNSGDAAQQQQAPAPDQGQAPPPDQGQAPQSEPGHGGHGYGMHNRMASPEQQLDHLSKRLKLTDDEKSKIMPILQDQAQQMQSLRQDTSMSPQDRRAKFQQIHQNTMSQIRPILDESQQKKFDKMMKEQEQRRVEHQGGGPGGEGNGPQ